MSERKAREFWIFGDPEKDFIRGNYGPFMSVYFKLPDFVPKYKCIHVREVLPDEASELERIRKEHTMMKECLEYYSNEPVFSRYFDLLQGFKNSARECLAKLEGEK